MNKLKFYIAYQSNYNSTIGGIIALHKLAHNLSILGEQTYINSSSKNPNWKGELFRSSRNIDFENAIGIYPEIVTNNPMNFKHTVRWILFNTQNVFPKTDWIYSYWDYFKINEENQNQTKGLLSAFDVQKEIFYDRGGRKSGKTCYAVRKGAYKSQDQHPKDAIRIDDYASKGGNEYLAKMFSECEFFVSYDDATFLTCQAILCGCIPIVIPNPAYSKEAWRNSVDLHRYGHAYGFDDVYHALITKKQFFETIEAMETKSLEQTKIFIQNCYNEIYPNNNSNNFTKTVLKKK